MPNFIVCVRKHEVIELIADVRVEAQSEESARTMVMRLHQHDAIDDRLWIEQDSWDREELIEIKEVSLDRSV